MHTSILNSSLRFSIAVSTLMILAACGDKGAKSPEDAASAAAPTPTAETSSVIQIDGSSTVYPLTEAVAEEFQGSTKGQVRVTVGVSGTGGGFKKFCRGELDISGASRPIQRAEMDICAAAGIKYFEIPVAYDALTVVVNPQNPLDSITVDELKRIWEPSAQGNISKWNQINPAWTDAEFTLYGAGSDSGTFDYFTEAVVGKAKSSRGDYTASEDDNVLVQGVANDVNAIGYFGYAYFAENQDKLKALAIQTTADAAGVRPSMETVIDGTYTPLARPMFIYVSDKAWARPEVKAFVEYYLANADTLAREVNYVPLPAEAYTSIRGHLEQGKLGTVFNGEAATAVTIEDLLKREAGL
jgi:phosphate transport system substrate-binding protein